MAKEEFNLWKASRYEVISVEENVMEDGKLGERVLIRVPEVGSTAVLFIPYHTEEEEREIGANFAHAAFNMCYPDDNPANYSAVRVVL